MFRYVFKNNQPLDHRRWSRCIIVNTIIAIYLLLSIIIIYGALSNYKPQNWYQTIAVVADDNYHSLIDNDVETEKTNIRIVLFETTDYYYVVDAFARGKDTISIYNLNYTFIDKDQCPVARLLVKNFSVIPSSNYLPNGIDRLAMAQFCIIGAFFAYLVVFLAYPHQKKE